MNNTKTLTIAAILTAATLVVGVTFAATATHSAFAFKKRGDKERDNGDGNTITAQINVQKGKVSGYDNSLEQEASNVICTHPHDECVSEGD
jgi:hypothetical protein